MELEQVEVWSLDTFCQFFMQSIINNFCCLKKKDEKSLPLEEDWYATRVAEARRVAAIQNGLKIYSSSPYFLWEEMIRWRMLLSYIHTMTFGLFGCEKLHVTKVTGHCGGESGFCARPPETFSEGFHPPTIVHTPQPPCGCIVVN